MSTPHHPTQIYVHPTNHPRCLRHDASMAACDDCRAARRARVSDRRQAAATAP
ncbi:MAG: hypothetical protein AVDCRST_MAG57-51 [uncultured Blastococcus sp.]|uniref:Uncharacterized protein n=1 Tax=uncultured Blastococcus sp. TaxID=217144 RepID=A0A6J4H375_9ACTN|nr:MAG: hypothetical protein AVDCRST_MAG57-51 [uncultured Blastococcus sp.]